MNRKAKLHFTLISMVIGFLVAVQFQTVKKPAERDTRDIWEIRQELGVQLEQQSILLSQIDAQEKTIYQYEKDQASSKKETLLETVEQLKTEAGMTAIEGTGITLELKPIAEEVLMGGSAGKISADLLQRLVNQLYLFNAQHISVNQYRLGAVSVIRDINGITAVNGNSLPALPITLTILSKNSQEAEKLYNRMLGSELQEDFFIDDIRLVINEPQQHLEVPAYDKRINVRSMIPQAADEEE
ncbi:DUF881 domain-containing protein [Jeotgalibacillus proteolyticus]|uniref:NgoFVII family restriction endonuclease n=1 Tax=Jeotgalibacillus proteolyticus TaxID=2082395 RepID=A0A2S5GGY7_9BACL|nr:DUF881 domain-containing protein [Jeotgalibacillus proteolyticus]PPA72133.1 NgoFVII family restriction endonuclease [Jeotgalibacillus proteolyticus]